MARSSLFQIFKFLVYSLLIVSCSNNLPTGQNLDVTPVGEQNYSKIMSDIPEPVSPISPVSSPLILPRKQMEPVVLSEPIRVGNTVVSGTGPADVPIKIYEVANTADLLGETIISKDGIFSVTLARSLQPTERVGIILGDLEGTMFDTQDFNSIVVREVPVYGYVLADVSVQP